MTETFLADREAILNKYHRLDRPYNSFQRFAYHGATWIRAWTMRA